MVAIIKEKEYEYVSDHPVGWKRSKGDFKFPVVFGHNKCFIKRFNKRTESISGWQLLVNLKGKNNPGLPRIHDIVTTTEKGETVNYLFMEFIEGDTLSKLLSEHVYIDLEKLTDDLISAFESINKYEFWFADFFEKNICSDKKGNFYLVDLDSAQQINQAPDRDMWGEKEYWGLVFDYYKKVLKKKDFQPSDLNGLSLNYLQVIFLILRIQIYSSKKNRDTDKEYNEITVSPSLLDKISPAFREVFDNALIIDPTGNTGPLIKQIRGLIKEFIIDSPQGNFDREEDDDREEIEPESEEPVIKEFSVIDGEETESKFIIDSESNFELSWKVENASDLQLYRNGQFFKTLEEGANSIELTEKVYDSEQKEIEYELIASNAGEVVSEKLTILVVVQKTPTIVSFRAGNYLEKNGSNYVVNNDEVFTLSWEVENAADVKLYRNGHCINETSGGRGEIELTENPDNKNDSPVKFRLEASSRAKATTSSLSIQVKRVVPDPVPVNPVPPKPPPPKQETEKVHPPKPLPIAVRVSVENYKSRNGNDDYTVVSGNPCKLVWYTENVANITLLRNGKPLPINPGDSFLELRETASGDKSTRVEYTLVAKGDSETQRHSVYLTAKKPVSVNFTVLVAALVLLVIVAVIGYKTLRGKGTGSRESTRAVTPPEPTKLLIAPLALDRISEGDTLKITGTGLPEIDHAISVKFNDASDGTILQQEADNVEVLVPHLNSSFANIKVIVNDSNQFTIARNVPYTAKVTTPTGEMIVKVFSQKGLSQVTEGENLTISGENFPKSPGLIEVTFNNVSGRIVRQNAKKIIVQVPKLPDPETVDIEMTVKGKFHTVAEGVKYEGKNADEQMVNNGKVTLNPFSKDVIIEGEIITITGNNIPAKTGSVEIIFDGKVLFPIVEQNSTVIRARVPTLVLKSGILAVKANGNFIPLPHSLVNYKLHQ